MANQSILWIFRSQYAVVYCCNDGFDLIRKIGPKFKPDIILLDQNMPNMDGVETVHWLKDNYPEIKTIILSMNHHEEAVLSMVLNGIKGYLLKDAELDEFKAALDSVRDGDFHYPSFVTNYLVSDAKRMRRPLPNELADLKTHEIEFIKLSCTELTYKEIADHMHVSLRSVDGYRDQIFRKYDIKSRVGIVLFAIKHKLI